MRSITELNSCTVYNHSYVLTPCLSCSSLHTKNLDKAAGEIKMKEFFMLFDSIHGNSHLPGDIRKRLTALYPQIKVGLHIVSNKFLLCNQKTLKKILPLKACWLQCVFTVGFSSHLPKS